METKIDKSKLLVDNKGNNYATGYRIVYFYDDYYEIGAFARNIEDFMVEFCECYPIEDDADIPTFVSIDDLLSRYLENLPQIIGIAIYRIIEDKTCIFASKNRK